MVIAQSRSQRWADFSSDSESSRPLAPRFGAPDDSYKGPPVETCEDSNNGLNEALKRKCVATEGTVEDYRTSHNFAAVEAEVASAPGRAPSDFSFLCEDQERRRAGSVSSDLGLQISPLRTPTPVCPVAEFYPSQNVLLVKRKLEFADSVHSGGSTYKPRKKRQKKQKNADQLSESTKTDNTVTSSTLDVREEDGASKKRVEASKSIPSKSSTSEFSDVKSMDDEEAEKSKTQTEQPPIDWDLRREQRIRDVQRVTQTRQYAEYCSCASISDPREPDPSSQLGKRKWKFELERWRRAVNDRVLERTITSSDIPTRPAAPSSEED